MIDEKIKKEFMKVEDGYMWNDFTAKYPGIKFSELDDEMLQHINEKLLRPLMAQERLENPHIHYEIPRRRK